MINNVPDGITGLPSIRGANGGSGTRSVSVLVVGVDAGDSRTLAGIIEGRDRHAIAVRSVKRALDVLGHREIDVVVLSVEGRNSTGFTLLSAIRKRPEFDRVSVLVVSAPDDPTSICRAIDLGANAVLAKPVHPAMVWMLLESTEEHVRRAGQCPHPPVHPQPRDQHPRHPHPR